MAVASIPLHIRVWLRNIGGQDANVTVKAYYDNQYVGAGNITVPAGGETYLDLSGNVNMETGEREYPENTIKIEVYYMGELMDSKEFKWGARITSVDASVEGDIINASATVQNTGDFKARFWVGFTLADANRPTEVYIDAEPTYEDIEPGETKTFSTTFSVTEFRNRGGGDTAIVYAAVWRAYLSMTNLMYGLFDRETKNVTLPAPPKPEVHISEIYVSV